MKTESEEQFVFQRGELSSFEFYLSSSFVNFDFDESRGTGFKLSVKNPNMNAIPDNISWSTLGYNDNYDGGGANVLRR